MKTRIIFSCALTTALGAMAQPAATAPVALGDSIRNSSHIVMIDGRKPDADSVRSLMEDFYADQFRHVQDPGAPYFMFMSRNAHLAMGIGGEVMLRGWFDWNGALPNGSFTPYDIPMHPAPTDLRHLGATASGTKLFLRAMGSSDKLGHYSLYVEAEFSGYNEADFTLKRAYATLNDWTVGLAPTTFSDPGALPPTVDRQGPNNKIDAQAILVRWMHTWKEHWTLAASVEYPSAMKMTDTDLARRCRVWVPDLGAFFQYQWNGQGADHVRLSATTRQLTYRNFVKKENVSKVGWGLQLSTMCSPARPLTLYGTLNGGRGIAGLGGDWMLNNYDMTPEPDSPGTMYAPYVLGYMVGVQYNILPGLFADVVYSRAHYYPPKPAEPDEYKSGDYGSVNVFYYITPRVRVGAGFNVGRRTNADGQSRTAYRTGLLAAFSF